jgi:membrane-associated phospholipid phosphatase
MHAAIGTNIFTSLFPSIFMGDDLFFSGHAGLPFLLALIFWDDVLLRTIFLGFSVLFSIVVLLGHLHYSIDVASAFFITFTIFVIAKKFFKKDWDLLNGTI